MIVAGFLVPDYIRRATVDCMLSAGWGLYRHAGECGLDSVRTICLVLADAFGLKLSALDYWQLFEQQAHLQVTLKASMSRLNRARGNLKHGGVLPAHDEIVLNRLAGSRCERAGEKNRHGERDPRR
jgi:hypothetical protein